MATARGVVIIQTQEGTSTMSDLNKVVNSVVQGVNDLGKKGVEPVSFDWGYELHHGEAANVVRECNVFCTDLIAGRNPRWLSLLGKPGTGKTHLAKRIREHYKAAKPNRITRFHRWKDIVDDYLLQWDFGIIDFLSFEVDLLILDDIGVEKATQIGLSNLYKVLDNRLGKWTIITSNLKLPQIVDMEGRVASRMVRGGSQIFTFKDCPDWSLEQFKKRQNDY